MRLRIDGCGKRAAGDGRALTGVPVDYRHEAGNSIAAPHRPCPAALRGISVACRPRAPSRACRRAAARSRRPAAARRGAEGMAVDQLEVQRDAAIGAAPAASSRSACRVARASAACAARRARAGRRCRQLAQFGQQRRRPSAQLSVSCSWSITGSAKPASTSMSPRSCMSTNGACGAGQPCLGVERAQAVERAGAQRREHQEAVDRERAMPGREHRLRVDRAVQHHVGPQQLAACPAATSASTHAHAARRAPSAAATTSGARGADAAVASRRGHVGFDRRRPCAAGRRCGQHLGAGAQEGAPVDDAPRLQPDHRQPLGHAPGDLAVQPRRRAAPPAAASTLAPARPRRAAGGRCARVGSCMAPVY